MYMRVLIRDGETTVEAFEHIDGDFVVGFVSPSGDPIDMDSFNDPRMTYVSREELEDLPA
jgi:hypothetical protein